MRSVPSRADGWLIAGVTGEHQHGRRGALAIPLAQVERRGRLTATKTDGSPRTVPIPRVYGRNRHLPRSGSLSPALCKQEVAGSIPAASIATLPANGRFCVVRNHGRRTHSRLGVPDETSRDRRRGSAIESAPRRVRISARVVLGLRREEPHAKLRR
jgi:hypothetical protein